MSNTTQNTNIPPNNGSSKTNKKYQESGLERDGKTSNVDQYVDQVIEQMDALSCS
jgi:hypothetical protein